MQATNNSTETPTPSGISRRTVVKGAAWAVPAIAVAGAVPAMAASLPCLQFTMAGAACKWPGETNNKAYNIVLSICNTCVQSQTITITRMENGSGKVMVPCGTNPFPLEVTVPAAVAGGVSCTEVPLGAFSTDSSANYIDVWGYVGTFQPSAPVSVLNADNSITAPPNRDECVMANPCTGVTTTTTTGTAAARVETTTTTAAPVETTTTTAAPVETTTTTAAPVETTTTTAG